LFQGVDCFFNSYQQQGGAEGGAGHDESQLLCVNAPPTPAPTSAPTTLAPTPSPTPRLGAWHIANDFFCHFRHACPVEKQHNATVEGSLGCDNNQELAEEACKLDPDCKAIVSLHCRGDNWMLCSQESLVLTSQDAKTWHHCVAHPLPPSTPAPSRPPTEAGYNIVFLS